jgi:UDP-N-acetylmuramoyl-L-alanyl-D-glutamate--2,6-diaminopimelate ligase
MTVVKSLAALLEVLPEACVQGDASRAISGLCYDSRRVEPGFLFAALPGQHTDGHHYVQDAVARGAVAVLVEQGKGDVGAGGATVVSVGHTRPALAALAHSFYDKPSHRLRLTGVTGTNGKTTTTYLVEAIMRAAGRKTGVIGTLAYRIGDSAFDAPFTTPEAPDLQALLARMVEAGVEDAAMEVSSHALSLHRADHCAFDCAIFTNLTRDHLDFHPTAEAYFEAKARLFKDSVFMPPAGVRVNIVNRDDESSMRLVQQAQGVTVTYGCTEKADVVARPTETSAQGTTFEIQTPQGRRPVRLRLLGRFNVYNALAAISAGIAMGVDLAVAAEAVESVPVVRGRFEKVEAGQEFAVLVDYSHTPDSLEKALSNARLMTEGRLLVVFGCGGDRDAGKRPIMGAAAARLADECFITSDNPRSEDPNAIIEQIAEGIPRSAKRRCRVEADRRQAIRMAMESARAGDTVLIAGKGHETRQIFADRVEPFDDREVAAQILRDLHGGSQ